MGFLRGGLAAGLAALVAVSTGSARPAARDGLIAFDDLGTASTQIFTMTPAGKRVRRLTRSAADDQFPAWSPDGRSIAFSRTPALTGSIYVMSASGRDLRPVTDPSLDAIDPTWSPDGRRLAFTLYPSGSRRPDIAVLDLRTGTVSNLTASLGGGSAPAWSPSGKRIAFLGVGDDWIYTIAPDGSGLRRVTQRPGAGYGAPAWSPDGKWLASAVGSGSLVVLRADGGGQRRLKTPANAADPAWSPDGRRITFSANPAPREGDADIYVVNARGGGLRRLTHDSEGADHPSWQRLQ